METLHLSEYAWKTKVEGLCQILLLNAFTLPSCGLLSGKAGVAAALFDAAGILEDDYLEDMAFDLLCEALTELESTEDASWENGTAGIGFAVMNLIKDKIIEGDFAEIFSELHEQAKAKTLKSIKEVEGKELEIPPENILYWERFNGKEEKTISDFITNAAEQHLDKRFKAIKELRTLHVCIDHTLDYWDRYLKATFLSTRSQASDQLIQDYNELRQSHLIKQSHASAVYLGLIQTGKRSVKPAYASSLMAYPSTTKALVQNIYLQIRYNLLEMSVVSKEGKIFLESTIEELEQRLSIFPSNDESKGLGMNGGIAALLLLTCHLYRTLSCKTNKMAGIYDILLG